MSDEDEDENARVDRELNELLQELRVALPSVQILSAFLLLLPFQNGFSKIDSGTPRLVYYASFIAATAATALLIAPSAYHRQRFRQGDKKRMLYTSNRLTVSGLALVAVALTGAMYLVTDVVFQAGSWVPIMPAIAAGWFAWFWFGMPQRRRLRYPDPPASSPTESSGSSPASR